MPADTGTDEQSTSRPEADQALVPAPVVDPLISSSVTETASPPPHVEKLISASPTKTVTAIPRGVRPPPAPPKSPTAPAEPSKELPEPPALAESTSPPSAAIPARDFATPSSPPEARHTAGAPPVGNRADEPDRVTEAGTARRVAEPASAGPETSPVEHPRRAASWLAQLAVVIATTVAGWFIVVELPDWLDRDRTAPQPAVQSVAPAQVTGVPGGRRGYRVDYPTFTDSTGITLTGVAAQAAPAIRIADGMRRSGAMWSVETLDPAESFSTAFRFSSKGGPSSLSFVLQTVGVGSNLPLDQLRPRLSVDFVPPSGASAGTVTVTTARTGSATRLGSTGMDLGPDGGEITAWVDYSAKQRSVRIFLSRGSGKPSKPLLTVPLTLSITLGEGPCYAGFIASTGATAGEHRLLAWFLSGPA